MRPPIGGLASGRRHKLAAKLVGVVAQLAALNLGLFVVSDGQLGRHATATTATQQCNASSKRVAQLVNAVSDFKCEQQQQQQQQRQCD